MEEQKEPESKEVVKTSSNGAESGAYNRSELPELLRVYYMWLFPYDKYFEWLQYGELLVIYLLKVVTVLCSHVTTLLHIISTCAFHPDEAWNLCVG